MTKQDRTAPKPNTLTKIPGYNTLTIYQMEASPFWYVRMYEDGKIYRRSTKTVHKPEAMKFAKKYFGEVQLLKMNMLPANRESSFELIARSLQEDNKARLVRAEISHTKFNYDAARLEKDLVPTFGRMRLADITYADMSAYLNKLSVDRKLAKSSLKVHLSHLKTVFKHGHKLGVIASLPAFPTVKTQDIARPWFNAKQYDTLQRTARRCIGKSFKQKTKEGVPLRNIPVTQELYDLILFMTNTFVRPTDIKVLKHKDVAVVRKDATYLRLTHGQTKGHSNPMISLPSAVNTYEKIKARQLTEGYGKPDDYVFQPERGEKQRDYALRSLQRQFEQVLIEADLRKDEHGQTRSLYSLRHTSIMLRLLNAKDLNTLTLARNARTSVEMIDRFYAKPLTAEMNVDALHSVRRPRKAKEPKVVPDDDDEVPRKKKNASKKALQV